MAGYPVRDQNQQLMADATMWTLMKAGMAERAYDYFTNVICDDEKEINQAVTIDRKNWVAYLFLQAGLHDYTDFKTMQELVDFYYQIKFCLRRLDFDLNTELQEEARTWLLESGIWKDILDGFIERDCINKEKVLEKLEKGIEPVTADTEKKQEPQTDFDHTFSFIICVNQELWFEEISHYIKNQIIPEGYGIEIIPVRNAVSMAEGYNRGMRLAKGKYKIYMHQDAFLHGRTMLSDILSSFEKNPKAGALGVAGCKKLPESLIWWECSEREKYMRLYQDTMLQNEYTCFMDCVHEGSKLLTLDGVLIVTRVDIPWREELFTGFHFYDLSQSMELHRAGYDVIVPEQTQVWCLHEQSCSRLLDETYGQARDAFQKEYGGEL